MDRVCLTLPDTSAYLPLLRLVLGGIAARGGMTFDAMDDLQLAVEHVLIGREKKEDSITMEVEMRDGRVDLRLGVLSDAALRIDILELSHLTPPDKPLPHRATVLRRLVDACCLENETTAGFSLRLTKICR